MESPRDKKPEAASTEKPSAKTEQPLFSEAFKREVLEEMSLEDLVRFADGHGLGIVIEPLNFDPPARRLGPPLYFGAVFNFSLWDKTSSHSSSSVYLRKVYWNDEIWKKMGGCGVMKSGSAIYGWLPEYIGCVEEWDRERSDRRYWFYQEYFNLRNIVSEYTDFFYKLIKLFGEKSIVGGLSVQEIGRVEESFVQGRCFPEGIHSWPHILLPDFLRKLLASREELRKFYGLWCLPRFDDSCSKYEMFSEFYEKLILSVLRGGSPDDFFNAWEGRLDEALRSLQQRSNELYDDYCRLVNELNSTTSQGPYR